MPYWLRVVRAEPWSNSNESSWKKTITMHFYATVQPWHKIRILSILHVYKLTILDINWRKLKRILRALSKSNYFVEPICHISSCRHSSMRLPLHLFIWLFFFFFLNKIDAATSRQGLAKLVCYKNRHDITSGNYSEILILDTGVIRQSEL